MKNKKICRNPECQKERTSIRKDCSNTCKNRYHYLNNLERYKADYEWDREYKRFRSELQRLYSINKTIVPISYFQFMGLDESSLKRKMKAEDGNECLIVNDLALTRDNDDNYVITKIDSKWK